jgi:hypothetical protein
VANPRLYLLQKEKQPMKKTVLLSLVLAVASIFTLPASAQTATRTSAVSEHDFFATATFNTLSANGSTAVFDIGGIMNTHTLACLPTGAPTTANVTLDGSLDGTNFYTLVTTQACTAFIAGFGVDKPARYIRATLTGLAGGTAPTITARYGGSR